MGELLDARRIGMQVPFDIGCHPGGNGRQLGLGQFELHFCGQQGSLRSLFALSQRIDRIDLAANIKLEKLSGPIVNPQRKLSVATFFGQRVVQFALPI